MYHEKINVIVLNDRQESILFTKVTFAVKIDQGSLCLFVIHK